MAEWHVSESEDEETKGGDTSNKRRDVIDSGGISIDHTKMLELLQALKTNRTLHLDCVTSHRKYERRKRKRKKEKGVMGQEMSVHSGVGGDFVSETASEMRSTHTASTGECRDTRRYMIVHQYILMNTYKYKDILLKGLNYKSTTHPSICPSTCPFTHSSIHLSINKCELL